MTPSVEPLGGGKLITWRLDQACFASTWDNGEGAFQLPSAGQQAFEDALLAKHEFVVIPSVVSNHSWKIVESIAKAGRLGL